MNWERLLSSARLRNSTRVRDSRNEFESDFGRIVFSPATRRMHDKTQVFPLTEDDNIHSRLTHSMEVMSIGHSLGIRVCEDKNFANEVGIGEVDLYRTIPILLKNACLVHDIGNPPFGHFGETVLQMFFNEFFQNRQEIKLTDLEKEDFLFFDGNAQGFRVLTKLQMLNDKFGLNLTAATLGAYLKYPNSGKKVKEKIHLKKRGIFQSEEEYLRLVADECGLKKGDQIVRHPLSFLMEAADSICYLVMDIEDGFNKGWYDFDFIVQQLREIEGIEKRAKEIEDSCNGIRDEITCMAKFRIYLLQRLVDLATKNWLQNRKQILEGAYNYELIFDDPKGLAESLKTFCQTIIFPKRPITSLELTGQSVINGLLEIFTTFVFHPEKGYRNRAQGLISDSIMRIAFLENGLPESSKIDDLPDYFKLRVIVDYVSGMTDQFALTQFQKLSGQKII